MSAFRIDARLTLIEACDRLLATETEVLAMDDAKSRAWFMNKPGHSDCFMVARALKELLTRGAIIHTIGPDALELFAFIQERELNLICRREHHGEEHNLWWYAVRRSNGKAVCHPNGSPQAAIRDARARLDARLTGKGEE